MNISENRVRTASRDAFGFARASAVRTATAQSHAVNQLAERRYTRLLSPRAAVFCVAGLNSIGWTAIMALVLIVLSAR